MKKDRKSWTDADLIRAVSSSKSIAGVLRSLNLIPAGGNYPIVQDKIKELNLDTSHFTGRGWNVGMKFKPNPPKPLEEILVNGVRYQSYKLLKRLENENIKPHICENCGLTEWMGKPISLELHHKNGDSLDNRLENLQVLCPNCHSQTDNYRGKKKKKSAPQETGDVESP